MITKIAEHIFFENKINKKYKSIVGLLSYAGRFCYEYKISENIQIGIVSYINTEPKIKKFGFNIIIVNNEVYFLNDEGEVLKVFTAGTEIYDCIQACGAIIVLSDIECLIVDDDTEMKIEFEDNLYHFELLGNELICILENGKEIKIDINSSKHLMKKKRRY